MQNSPVGIFDPDPTLRTPLQLNYTSQVTHGDGTINDPGTMIDVHSTMPWARDCLSLRSIRDYNFTDSQCGEQYASICEWKGEILMPMIGIRIIWSSITHSFFLDSVLNCPTAYSHFGHVSDGVTCLGMSSTQTAFQHDICHSAAEDQLRSHYQLPPKDSDGLPYYYIDTILDSFA